LKRSRLRVAKNGGLPSGVHENVTDQFAGAFGRIVKFAGRFGATAPTVENFGTFVRVKLVAELL
jgi:hypothetical protein